MTGYVAQIVLTLILTTSSIAFHMRHVRFRRSQIYSVLNTSILVSRLTVKLALRRQVWVEILSVSQQALRGLLRTVQGS